MTIFENCTKLLDAIIFAFNAHREQPRKGTDIPYIVHPLSVAQILMRWGCSLNLVIAGILHDTVEDTDVSLEDIEKNFGTKIRKIVEDLTEPSKSLPWELRKQHTLDRLKTLDEGTLLVALADKLDNIKSIEKDIKTVDVWRRFNSPKEKQEWYYRSLVEVFLERFKDSQHREKVFEFKSVVERVFG